MSEYTNVSVEELSGMSIQALRASKFDEAVEITEEIIAREPDNSGAYAVQFSSLFKAEKFERARQMGGTAAALNPNSVFILNNQACLQLEAKQPAAAAGLLKALIDQFGERAQWLYNLALAQRMVGNYEYSIATFRRTLDHQPDHDRAAFQLADCLSITGQKEDAIRAYDYVRLLRDRHAPSHSNYIHNAVANGGLTIDELRQEMHLWEDRFIPQENRYPLTKIENKDEVRIGFLLGVLPTSWLEAIVAPVINHLAMGNDAVFVYWHDEKMRHDVFNEKVEVVYSPKSTDADFARRGRSDKIQILVDVCGMRLGSRQRTLGLQLAGREFGWLAHEGAYATPVVELMENHLGLHRFYVSEDSNVTKSVLPGNTLAGIGCQSGLSHQVIKMWASILLELPDWKLHLDSTSPLVIRLLEQRFHKLGINKDRLVFDENLGIAQDTIVLDNFVENDPVAATNAVSNGGILVALHGDLFPAQQSAALLEQLGKPDWVCRNLQSYRTRVLTLVDGVPVQPVSKSKFKNSGVRDLNRFCHAFRDIIVG